MTSNLIGRFEDDLLLRSLISQVSFGILNLPHHAGPRGTLFNGESTIHSNNQFLISQYADYVCIMKCRFPESRERKGTLTTSHRHFEPITKRGPHRFCFMFSHNTDTEAFKHTKQGSAVVEHLLAQGLVLSLVPENNTPTMCLCVYILINWVYLNSSLLNITFVSNTKEN